MDKTKLPFKILYTDTYTAKVYVVLSVVPYRPDKVLDPSSSLIILSPPMYKSIP